MILIVIACCVSCAWVYPVFVHVRTTVWSFCKSNQYFQENGEYNLPIIELAMYVCVYVSHVLDRKLLERLMSPSQKSQVMFAPAFSWIGDFFRIFGIHIFQVMASLVNLV